MLWYLHLCAVAGVIVVEYTDNAEGTMREAADGSGHFIEVTLRPIITLADSSMRAKADAQHAKANKMCFIANSCNFPVHHKPVYQIIHG
jgi:organic hydroperoxide reductase OsmC/OhrA